MIVGFKIRICAVHKEQHLSRPQRQDRIVNAGLVAAPRRRRSVFSTNYTGSSKEGHVMSWNDENDVLLETLIDDQN